MGNRSFALLAVAILLVAGAGGAIAIKSQDEKEQTYEEVLMFYEICKVPRISGYNDKIGDFLVDFAKEYNLKWERDSVGNVMIDHPGKISKRVILQSHMDMVGVVEPGFMHDFTLNPIKTVINDGYFSAEHTSLGADDGAGMAIALCALISPELSDYGFRCIFTIDEETDMKGAKNMSTKWLEGFDYMINIDNDVDSQILFGSAGSYNHVVSQKFNTEAIKHPDNVYGFNISGLFGGHSGMCIDMNRANGILVALKFVSQFTDAQLIQIKGGQAGNAIPDGCYVIFSCAENEQTVNARWQEMLDKWTFVDIGFKVKLGKVTGYDKALSIGDTGSLLNKILSMPNGMKEKYMGYVITSSNLGLISLNDGDLTMTIFSRSALDDDLAEYEKKFTDIFGKDHVTVTSKNPAWFGDYESLLCGVAFNSYKSITGKDPELSITHGGLETGYFTQLAPGMQIISIGPEIFECHTTAESLSLESFHNLKLVVFDMIKNLS